MQLQRHNWIYKAQKYLNLELTLSKVITLVIAGLFALYGYIEQNSVFSYAGLIIAMATLLFYLIPWVILFIIINEFMKNCGAKFIDSIDDYFTTDKSSNPKRIRIDTRKVNNSIFYFPGKQKNPIDQLAETVRLHNDAFLGTPWGSDVTKRNSEHLGKNDLSIMFILKDGEPVAFTHVVAISEMAWFSYKNGEINDHEFYGHLIFPRPTNSDTNKPKALLLLCAAISESRLRQKGALTPSTSQCLAGAAAYHLDQYLQREFENDSIVPVMFQTMRYNIIRLFKKTMINKREYSKDNARIICFEVENTHCESLKP